MSLQKENKFATQSSKFALSVLRYAWFLLIHLLLQFALNVTVCFP